MSGLKARVAGAMTAAAGHYARVAGSMVKRPLWVRVGGAWQSMMVRLTDHTVTHAVAAGGATATFRINADGTANGIGGLTVTYPDEWRLCGASADYEVRFTHVSGMVPTGTLGTWLSCSSSRSVSVSRGTIGTNSGVVLVELRMAALPSVALASCQVTLTATKDA